MWNDPVTSTPSIVQVDFGAYGQNLPGDGESYCGPTSVVMGLYWLSGNGFTQLAPEVYNGQEDPAAVNLERVIGGLMSTSVNTGTSGTGIETGVADFFSACGIGSDLYTLADTDNPDLDWLAAQLAPNVADDPTTIALVVFSVGWFYQPNKSKKNLSNDGGHVLAPLVADTDAGTVTLNNAYPDSFEKVPNSPASNPQTVTITQMASGWTLQNLSLPSQDYAEVVTPILGSYPNYAILWGGQAWTISMQALPSAPDYELQTWTLASLKQINTNGGTLTVLAPLAGAGAFDKCGQGTLLLANINDLAGDNVVEGGTLASTQTSGAPFGTGTVTLQGGGALQLWQDAVVSVDVTIASGEGAALTTWGGGGALQLSGDNEYIVTIGGNTDGTTPNVSWTDFGSLLLVPGGGLAELGVSQTVLVAGSDGNLPVVTNGIVAPYILGQDNDTASSGAFLTYDSSIGFQAAPTVLSTDVGINDLPRNTVYEVVDIQTIDSGGQPQVAGLEVSGGEVAGTDAVLYVGSWQSGDNSGVILNGGSVTIPYLDFGEAEGVIYTSAEGGTITSLIYGTAALTVFGPGALTLTGDNAQTLSGQVSVNAGTLVSAGGEGSATGTGPVSVYSTATLELVGSCVGEIDVGQSGVLYLNGGIASGGVMIAAIGDTSAAPGGILQGGGSISGQSTISGVIQSGPSAGILAFQEMVTIEGASFFWRLQALVDNSNSEPGVDWNSLTVSYPGSIVGSASSAMTYYLDFSALDGDPDGGDPFWNSQRTWTIVQFESSDFSCYWNYGNFYYASGNFKLIWLDDVTVGLQWNPVEQPQSLADRRIARAQDRGPAA